jgi:hypothetical protein
MNHPDNKVIAISPTSLSDVHIKSLNRGQEPIAVRILPEQTEIGIELKEQERNE